MTSHAGILARAVTRGERTLLEALDEMSHWVESFTEKVAGDDVSVDKARAKVVEFLIRDLNGPLQRTLPVGWDNGLTVEQKKDLGLGGDDVKEDWDVQRIKQLLIKAFEDHPDSIDDPNCMIAIETALERMARNESLDSLNEDMLIRFIHEQSKKRLPITTLRKRIREMQAGAIEGLDHIELADAVIKDQSQYGEIRFHNERFWQWKGACWEMLPETALMKYIATE